MTRVALQPGFVLHRYSYRETSWLLEVFSRDHGRIPVIARGVRNAKSRLRALLQPFTPLLFSWSGKGDLFNLTAAETEGLPFQVPGRRLYSALYLNELLLQLLARSDRW
jgi:DNA repair protein RecO (recombination protein O)